MSIELSEEERKKYEGARDEFNKLKTSIDEEIAGLEKRIQLRKNYLARIRPVIPGADRECDKCGLVSMKHIGSFPYTRTDLQGDFIERSSKSVYECAICGNSYTEPATSFD